MTGIKDYNFPAFDAAEEDLKKRGFDPISPASMDREAGFDPATDGEFEGAIEDIINRDLDAIVNKVDALALLPGWEESTGTNAEIGVAVWRGLRIYLYPDMVEFYPYDPPLDIKDDGKSHPKAIAGSKKDPLYLLPPVAKAIAARVHALGADKYGAYNWRYQKIAISDYLSAMLRHIDSVVDGNDIDEESGEHHLGHVIATCNIVLDALHCGQLIDNRVLPQKTSNK